MSLEIQAKEIKAVTRSGTVYTLGVMHKSFEEYLGAYNYTLEMYAKKLKST